MSVSAVHSTKYDGSLHYQFPLCPVHEEPGLVVASQSPGAPMRSYRGGDPTAYHSLHYYWARRHYNLCVMWRPDWTPRCLYVNIATPATWGDGVVRFVDLDLDVMWRAEWPAAQVDDADEFEEHRVTMGYPPRLVAQAREALDEVLGLCARQEGPFRPASYGWRPGRPVPR